ncbi:MAG: PEP-CTERM sorting domain-containing protein [Planctomycetota bacterium]|nr:PEP-CTERM sorting domain-containing protein [Planctomycetota bacterium]
MNRLYGIVVVGSLAAVAGASEPMASYLFDGSLAPEQAGVPALERIDPMGTSGFVSDTVFGQTRSVYWVRGINSPPTSQGGLRVPASLLLPSASYSVEMVFLFTDRAGAWRRILDVTGRQTDQGFYVDPSNHLDVYPIIGSSTNWTNDAYHHVVLTVSGGFISAYLDGSPQFNTVSTLMNTQANTPMVVFADNTVAGGQAEWSNARIALLRLYDTPLTPAEVAALASDPFSTPSTCPADFNADRGVDGSDIDAFFSAWEAGDGSADVNLDGGVDGSDIGVFFEAWEAGGC